VYRSLLQRLSEVLAVGQVVMENFVWNLEEEDFEWCINVDKRILYHHYSETRW
jgi:hypothetical protein